MKFEGQEGPIAISSAILLWRSHDAEHLGEDALTPLFIYSGLRCEIPGRLFERDGITPPKLLAIIEPNLCFHPACERMVIKLLIGQRVRQVILDCLHKLCAQSRRFDLWTGGTLEKLIDDVLMGNWLTEELGSDL